MSGRRRKKSSGSWLSTIVAILISFLAVASLSVIDPELMANEDPAYVYDVVLDKLLQENEELFEQVAEIPDKVEEALKLPEIQENEDLLSPDTDTDKPDQNVTEETVPEQTVDIKQDETVSDNVNGEMAVHFLDVEQGLAVFVQCDGLNLIYDGGDRGTSSYVVAYLKNMGVETIDYLISSHYDSDHVAGLIGCLNAFEVKNVISSDYVHESKTYESFVNAVAAEGLMMQHPSVGSEFSFGSGKFIVMGPDHIDEDDSNANSVVIKLVHGENSFMLMGDAEIGNEERMCAAGLDVECDVLVAGHHGSATATGWTFLQKAVPEYAVISCGIDNKYGHPHEEVMERLEAGKIQIYRTDKQGWISVVSDGTVLDWSQPPCNDYSPGINE